MNRIFPRIQPARFAPRKNLSPLIQRELRQRQVAEALLREVAYVLQLTRRVKAELQAVHDPLQSATS